MSHPRPQHRAHPNGVPPPPPTNHVLMPHHLQLMKLLGLVFHEYKEADLPKSFQLHLYRLLLVEIMEVKQPPTYARLLASVMEGAKATTEEAHELIQEFRSVHIPMKTPHDLRFVFENISYLVTMNDDDDDVPFARRSLFGYFSRRCFLSYLKLSHEALILLYRDYMAWIAGEFDPNTLYIKKDLLDMSYNIHQTKSDKREFSQPDGYGFFLKEMATGDNKSAADRLRGFFEQYFHEAPDSGLRHIAMLNLARMYYIHHDYAMCRKLLKEAIAVARNANDMMAVQHCDALLHRLPPVDESKKPTINEIQFYLHPLELLYDIKKLLQVNNEQPLSAAWEKHCQAVVLFTTWHDFHRGFVMDTEQWAQHAVQSVIWSSSGCSQLAEIEETVVLAFTEPGSDDNNRLTMTLNRAQRMARQGKYKEAISMLLNPDVFAGLTITDYGLWAAEIWHILALRSSRRGQERMYHEFLKPKQPMTNLVHQDYWYSTCKDAIPSGSIIKDPLFDVLAMRQVDQAHQHIEPLLRALWHSEFQQRYGSYRVAILMLADIGLEYGLTKWCRRIVDEIMPQVINGDDLELRAFALVTLARCIMASTENKSEGLREALQYLKRAETDYRDLEMFSSLQDVQFLLSVVYHNLGMTKERDEMAELCHETQAERKRLATIVSEQWISDVWEIVGKVGAALASR
ncbi:hypothetical protein K474DRAFT_1702690 [Panus rudis PR-1116 ss-1]|nr:hypothetical protein K474DRAFT_1702690 [Panus rudis PR-1116 ss-1]